MFEKTLVIIKPDGIERGLASQIISRIGSAGLNISEQKDIYITTEQAERLYAEHKDQPYFEKIVEYIMSGMVKVMIIDGEDAVLKMRSLMGPTDPQKAPAGTIRGDFKFDNPDKKVIKNTVHGSDSVDSASREIRIFFE